MSQACTMCLIHALLCVFLVAFVLCWYVTSRTQGVLKIGDALRIVLEEEELTSSGEI